MHFFLSSVFIHIVFTVYINLLKGGNNHCAHRPENTDQHLVNQMQMHLIEFTEIWSKLHKGKDNIIIMMYKFPKTNILHIYPNSFEFVHEKGGGVVELVCT